MTYIEIHRQGFYDIISIINMSMLRALMGKVCNMQEQMSDKAEIWKP